MPQSDGGLLESCRTGRLDQLVGCLSGGEPVDARDAAGVTALHVCSARGWTAGVATLLEHGADVNLASPLGWTALMQAARNGHGDTVDRLLDAGARLTDKNSHGWDALSLSVASHNYALVMKLVPKVEASKLTNALAIACVLGRLSVVKFLLSHHADVDGCLSDSGLTPLMLAASVGHKDIVKFLISHGAKLDTTNSSNLTAMDMAAINGHKNVEILLCSNMKSSKAEGSASFLSPYANPRVAKFSLHDPISPLCEGFKHTAFYHPCTPAFNFSCMGPPTPRIFNFPTVPSCAQYSPNPYSPCFVFPCHSPVPTFAYDVSPTLYKSHSPFCSSSRILPPGVFSSEQRNKKTEHKQSAIKSKLIRKWWRNLKRRCRRRKPYKKTRIHVTDAEEPQALNDNQFEALLCRLNLSYLLPIFRTHEIDFQTFRHLRAKDLEELGIFDKITQHLILQKISEL